MTSKTVKNIFINLLFLTIGLFAFIGIGYDIDLNKTWTTFLSLKPVAIFLVLIATIAAYAFRIYRWQMLLQVHEKKISNIAVTSSLMYGYFVNLGIPRLGEITRAASITKQSTTPFSFSLGSIILERLIDILSLLILLIFYFIFYFDILVIFYHEKFAPNLINLPQVPLWLWTAGTAGVMMFCYVAIKKLPILMKKKLQSFFHGISSIIKIKHKWLFVFLTLGIWISYFFTSYFCFYSFDHKYTLSITAGISVLILGSVARSVPIQAGAAGIYHTAISYILTMSLFDVDEQTAFTIAFIIHAIQTLFQLFVGGACALYVSFVKRD